MNRGKLLAMLEILHQMDKVGLKIVASKKNEEPVSEEDKERGSNIALAASGERESIPAHLRGDAVGDDVVKSTGPAWKLPVRPFSTTSNNKNLKDDKGSSGGTYSQRREAILGRSTQGKRISRRCWSRWGW